MSDGCRNNVIGGWVAGGNFLNGTGDKVLKESGAELKMKADEQYVGGSRTLPSMSKFSVARKEKCFLFYIVFFPTMPQSQRGLPHSVLCSFKLPLALVSKRREKS